MDDDAREQLVFAVVGAGWRSEFYFRVARALPERFRISGAVVRDPAAGRAVEGRWGFPSFRTLDELIDAERPGFLVVSVPVGEAPGVVRHAVDRGLPVLAETPAAASLDELIGLHELVRGGARIQVAEQYHLEPLLASQLAIANSGILGRPSYAHVSVSHDYHGMSILRRALDVGFRNATIRATRFASPIVAGPTRAGDPRVEQVLEAEQTIATLDFGDALGVYDFSERQYRSWIRSNRMMVRGDRGEVHDSTVRYLKDFRTPIEYALRRVSTGEGTNLEGYFLRGLQAGESWVYTNPYQPARLMDDEIAIATCLERMGAYAAGGESFYGVAEAAQDQYLSLMMHDAAATGGAVTTTTQRWATG